MTQLVVAATVEQVVELTAQGRHGKRRTPSGQHELVASLGEEIHHRTGGKPPLPAARSCKGALFRLSCQPECYSQPIPDGERSTPINSDVDKRPRFR